MSTRTKIILRIAVTLVVLGLVVLAVWLIWLKPTNELEVFQNLTSLQDEEQANFKSALNEETYGVQNRDYFVEKNAKYTLDKYSSTSSIDKVYGQIAYYRTYMFGGFSASANTNPYVKQIDKYENKLQNGTSSIDSDYNSCLGLESVYNLIDEAFDYYYSYVQLAEDVDREAVKEMNRLISDLSSDYKGFCSLQSGELTNLYKASVNASNTTTILHEVCAIYEKLYYKYFDIVESYNDLTLELKDFVTEYVFDGVVSYDKNTVAYEVLLNSVSEFTTQARKNNEKGVANYKVFTKDTNNEVIFNDNATYISYSADVASVIYAHQYSKVTDALVSTYAEIGQKYSEALTGNKSVLKFDNNTKNSFVTQYYSTAEKTPGTETYNNIQSTYNLDYLSGLQDILSVMFKLDNTQKAQYTPEEVA